MPKTGWCSHPQRKQSNDLLLMVRSNELPCRDGWSHDLFVAVDEALPESNVVAFDDVVIDSDESRRDPRVAASGAASNPSSMKSSMSTDVDIVVGEGPSMMGPSNRPSLIELQPRNAILKAREQYRARLAAESRGEEALLAPSSETADKATPAAGFVLTEMDTWKHVPPADTRVRMPVSNDVPPVQASEIGNDFPQMITKPSDDAIYSSVPQPVPGIVLPRAVQSVRPSSPAVAGAHEVPDRELVGPLTIESNSTPAADFTITPLIDVRGEDPAPVAGEQTGDDQAGFEVVAEDEDVQWLPYPPRRERRPLFGRKRRLFIEEHARVQHEPVRAYETEYLEAEIFEEEPEPMPVPVAPRLRVPKVRREEIAAAAAGPDPAVLAPHRVDVGLLPDVVAFDNAHYEEPMPAARRDPSIPRVCETCRDFRPGEKQGRGRCMNTRAFAETAVVSPTVLACSSSFGDWWSLADSFWLSEADISLHGQPTPLVDAWLARKVESATAKSDERHAVRRRKQS